MTLDFSERLEALATQAQKQLDHIQTEEATKTALVLPFLSALGYNVFDPTQVVPEFVADVGVKKGEKVDYAILHDGRPVVLIECKHHLTKLADAHMSQLLRYFTVTEAQFGILTNGIEYWFFADLEEPNKMDAKPFLKFDIFDFDEATARELRKFSPESFDIEAIRSSANDLKYTREIKHIIAREAADPSDELVRFLAKQVYSGHFTQSVRSEFSAYTRTAFRQYVTDRINERLKNALIDDTRSALTDSEQLDAEQEHEATVTTADDGIETTTEEVEAFFIVKAILRDTIEPKRICMRDSKSYCSILVDDNNRKPVCRLRFNYATKRYVGVFDEEKNETRIPIEHLDDIFHLADSLKETALRYR